MKRCWDEEPEGRPTADKIVDAITKWQSDEQILLELSRSRERYKQALNQKIASGKIIDSDEIYSDEIYSDKIYTDSANKLIL
ncbi:2800_t:CDS:1, partial [Cetraspora pellucida]